MAKILCIDDALVMRRLLKQILESKGHTVLTAEDGDKAMVIARTESVDLVLSDVNMPNMSGTSLVPKLRRLDNYRNTPIVMVTTESGGYKKDKLKSLGANGWLRKPFTEQQVSKVLDHFLK
ncbi:MAG: response regulator [Gammaproteobacteria bacterium]|nr:response regulator [Gammaproteobacteria bacterium]